MISFTLLAYMHYVSMISFPTEHEKYIDMICSNFKALKANLLLSEIGLVSSRAMISVSMKTLPTVASLISNTSESTDVHRKNGVREV
jgi:hypothetical protein